MSILGDIKRFSKKKLKPTATTIRTVGGRCWTETHDKDGRTHIEKISDGALGFVGDYKPDLQVGLVLPGLIIGSQDIAADFELLRRHKVTHILNIASHVENAFPKLFKYKRIRILDLPSEKITHHFPDCFEFIAHGMSRGCVLVHCNAGVSRASTVVIGFLMLSKRMKYTEAYEFLKAKRPCIRPNDGFRNQLKEYELSLRSLPRSRTENDLQESSESGSRRSSLQFSRKDIYKAEFLGL